MQGNVIHTFYPLLSSFQAHEYGFLSSAYPDASQLQLVRTGCGSCHLCFVSDKHLGADVLK